MKIKNIRKKAISLTSVIALLFNLSCSTPQRLAGNQEATFREIINSLPYEKAKIPQGGLVANQFNLQDGLDLTEAQLDSIKTNNKLFYLESESDNSAKLYRPHGIIQKSQLAKLLGLTGKDFSPTDSLEIYYDNELDFPEVTPEVKRAFAIALEERLRGSEGKEFREYLQSTYGTTRPELMVLHPYDRLTHEVEDKSTLVNRLSITSGEQYLISIMNASRRAVREALERKGTRAVRISEIHVEYKENPGVDKLSVIANFYDKRKSNGRGGEI